MFKMKPKKRKTKQLPSQPFPLAKRFFGIRANTVVYIQKRLLTDAVEITNIMDCGWQSNGDMHWLHKPIPTEIKELLVNGDDVINNDMEYENLDEMKSDNQQDEL